MKYNITCIKLRTCLSSWLEMFKRKPHLYHNLMLLHDSEISLVKNPLSAFSLFRPQFWEILACSFRLACAILSYLYKNFKHVQILWLDHYALMANSRKLKKRKQKCLEFDCQNALGIANIQDISSLCNENIINADKIYVDMFIIIECRKIFWLNQNINHKMY